ncbi:PASTA domain-containing protein [Nonomuraea sp. LPB2021202275-12-8]|uniref:PASTA domain-containing protein n=1 Tax=Nonomuraea sp. LPB2021202275-12-8 TaxID=3120159 RepID=UPI00300C962D
MKSLRAVPAWLRPLVVTAVLGAAVIAGTQPVAAATATSTAAAPLCATQNGVRYCEMPDVRGLRVPAARATLSTYGFTVGTQNSVVDHICNHIGEIQRQSPKGTVGASPRVLYPQGTAVAVWVYVLPSHPCP